MCPDSSHAQFPKGLHVLLCETHKGNPANTKILEEYKKNVLQRRSTNFKTFTTEISLICYTGNSPNSSLADVSDSAIFMLQTIDVNNLHVNLFFDSGCGDIVVKKSAVDELLKQGRAEQKVKGPLILKGVGDKTTICEHGMWSVKLPLRNGGDATLTGYCLDKVTATFPIFNLQEIEKDLRAKCKKQDGESMLQKLPKLSKCVGGDTDILIGSRYSRCHPNEVWRVDGLRVYDSSFLSADGTTGVIWGPHPDIDRQLQNQFQTQNVCLTSYFPSTVSNLRERFEKERGLHLLDEKIMEEPCFLIEKMRAFNEKNEIEEDVRLDENVLMTKRTPKLANLFDEIESAGTEVSYRCIDCRDCSKCKKGPRIDALSIQEEVEQDIIERGVVVDPENATSTSTLPFLCDPDVRLTSNDKFARCIFDGQIRMLAKSPEDREVVIESEKSCQDLGFVDFLENLPLEDQEMILNSPVKYVIPWRVVWNKNSKTTPCRVVLDGSACPRGKCSLNSTLAKGTNNMNKLIEILIRWLIHKYAFHTDIRKFYNSIHLHKSHWRFHLYLWSNDLTLGNPPKLKVLKTFIYGVKPSGNVAECAIRKAADLSIEDCPKAHDPIHKDTYVDDCASGADTEVELQETTDQLSLALARAGLLLKGYTFSGYDPPPHLSKDGKSIMVGGLKWFSREDYFSLNVPDRLNFSKKKRGRKTESAEGVLPEMLTRRDCASKVGEVFDPLGRVTPITSGMKLDLHQLTLRNLDWDDVIPDSLREVWSSNFEMIQEIGSIKYKRAVIPEDAIDTQVETIDTGDASESMVCIAIYARFRLKSGGYSCQLVFARSKVVPQDMSVPRAELLAASLNASTGFVVKKAFGERHQSCLKLSDSEVALHWIGCPRTRLKTWARNRVIECNRLTNIEDWRKVDTKDNIADLGTRKGAKLPDVSPGSVWIGGKDWYRNEEVTFPLKSISEIVLGPEGQREARKEYLTLNSDDAYFFGHMNLPVRYVPDTVR